MERWKGDKDEQNQELVKLANVFKSDDAFDLMRKATEVGTLMHKFTSLKLESQQTLDIKAM